MSKRSASRPRASRRASHLGLCRAQRARCPVEGPARQVLQQDRQRERRRHQELGIPLVPFQFYSVDDGTGQITVIGHSGVCPRRERA